MFNRAVQGQYGPGSAFKPFIAVAMLEENAVKAEQVFNATGTSQYGVRDWIVAQGGAPFGPINLTDALAMSSNHYFAKFGTDVGIDRISVWLREFGFGSQTGIIGISEEASGLVPDRDWKKQYFSGYSPSDRLVSDRYRADFHWAGFCNRYAHTVGRRLWCHSQSRHDLPTDDS